MTWLASSISRVEVSCLFEITVLGESAALRAATAPETAIINPSNQRYATPATSPAPVSADLWPQPGPRAPALNTRADRGLPTTLVLSSGIGKQT